MVTPCPVGFVIQDNDCITPSETSPAKAAKDAAYCVEPSVMHVIMR